MLAADAVRSFRFTTDDLPEPRRGLALAGLRERGILPLEPLPDRAAHANLTKHFLPGVGILCGTLSGLRHGGTPRTEDAGDELFFAVNLAGCSTATQGDREIAFGAGEGVLLSGAQGGFNVVRATPSRFVGLRLPRRLLEPLAGNLEDRTMRVIRADAEPVRLLIGYVGAIASLPAAISTETAGAVAAHLHDLIALALGAAADVTAIAGLRAARLKAIKGDILNRLCEGDLTVAGIAERHGLSPRYIHKLFESDGTTFTRFVLVQRLDRAYRMLRSSLHSGRSISAIAYDTGFGDLSYFNRTFRGRYGATPSDIRRRKREEAETGAKTNIR